ncbi:radical SAM additional 4Fe4S-binding domain-containing protein [Candidatus Magnetomorum sp. HK-1]|nr:radical SAM additional 4Fe4S-binding domain-containing protein [Candidatus Magnetomorum sp. HK-1]
MKYLLEKFKLYDNYHLRKLIVNLLSSGYFWNNKATIYLHNKEIQKKLNKFHLFVPVVQVEVSNFCNAKCIMCPNPFMTRKKGQMDDSLYKKIIDELSKWPTPLLHLCGIGESLLDKKIIERVRYAKNKQIKNIRINTNGSLLTREMSDAFIDLELDELLFSIDHGEKDKYEEIRRNLSFQDVYDNISYIALRKKQLRRNKPKIGINAVAQENELKQVQTVYKRFKKIADSISFQVAWNWVGDVSVNNPLKNKIKRNFPCPYLWYYLNITWDGNVSICCVDWDNEIILGNVANNSLQEIWRNDKFEHLRNLHINNRSNEISVCKKCDNISNWFIKF